jgi:hypothetical protein
MEDSAHVLVVANRTADSDELLAALTERARRDAVRFTLLVPATPHGVAWAADMHSGSAEAQTHMDHAVERLRDAGLEVADGALGDPDPVAAVNDLLNAGRRFDEVIVSTLPKHVSRWLKLDLPSRVERSTGLPVTHVEASEEKAG